MSLEKDAKPGDIYQTSSGALYKVTGYQANPTVVLCQITDSIGNPLPRTGEIREICVHALGSSAAKNFHRLGAFAKVEEAAHEA